MQVLRPNPSAIYTGVLNAISKISATEGVTSLWRGMNSVIIGAGKHISLHIKALRMLCTLLPTNTAKRIFLKIIWELQLRDRWQQL